MFHLKHAEHEYEDIHVFCSVRSMCLYCWTSVVTWPETSEGLCWTCWSRAPPLCLQDTGPSSLTSWCRPPPWPSVCPLLSVHDWIRNGDQSGDQQLSFLFFSLLTHNDKHNWELPSATITVYCCYPQRLTCFLFLHLQYTRDFRWWLAGSGLTSV